MILTNDKEMLSIFIKDKDSNQLYIGEDLVFQAYKEAEKPKPEEVNLFKVTTKKEIAYEPSLNKDPYNYNGMYSWVNVGGILEIDYLGDKDVTFVLGVAKKETIFKVVIKSIGATILTPNKNSTLNDVSTYSEIGTIKKGDHITIQGNPLNKPDWVSFAVKF